jgi:hypothetical protein
VTSSNDGDVSNNHGGIYGDGWVVKLNSSGAFEWQKCLGGSSNDDLNSIQKTNDGGYIVAGNSQSCDGDVTGNHTGPYGDGWIVKLNSGGTIEWQKCLGGNGAGGEGFNSVQQTTNGGYIVTGTTTSNDGDVSGNHGVDDCWVVKLNSTGSIEWQKCYGGGGRDDGNAIQQTSDGDYIIAVSLESGNSGAPGYHGNGDGWIIKMK